MDRLASSFTQERVFSTRINQAIMSNASLEEIENPGLVLPSTVDSAQIKKYFRLDTTLFALVLQPSMNVQLDVPEGFRPAFSGLLVAHQGDARWTEMLEIRDTGEESHGNNPYYLLIEDGQLLLTVVDQNGAGSGEGMMKAVFLSKDGEWIVKRCHSFSGYNQAEDGDYFAFSTKFSRQEQEHWKLCSNAVFISHE